MAVLLLSSFTFSALAARPAGKPPVDKLPFDKLPWDKLPVDKLPFAKPTDPPVDPPVGPTLSVECSSVVGLTATYNVSWSNYLAYAASVYADCYKKYVNPDTGEVIIYYSGYTIGMNNVVNDGTVHEDYAATGLTVVFGQNCLVSNAVQPISGKYVKIRVVLFDEGRNIIAQAESAIMDIP